MGVRSFYIDADSFFKDVFTLCVERGRHVYVSSGVCNNQRNPDNPGAGVTGSCELPL